MSYCRKDGKDTITFLTEDDCEKRSEVYLNAAFLEPQGAVLPNGDINWSCPCIEREIIGPCGVEFRDSFGCYSNKEARQKDKAQRYEDCKSQFEAYLKCMVSKPRYYREARDLSTDTDIDNLEQNSESSVNSRTERKS